MRLEIASRKAIEYACKNFHYSGIASPRSYDFSFSVFNNDNCWCGVICYGLGATPQIGNPYNLKQGQCIELIRIALNGKQESTSKIISISLRLLKKYNPLVKLVVSYADKKQNHIGTVYQASNWIYVGSTESSGTEYFINNKWRHAKAIKPQQKKIAIKRKSSGKYKYLYPLTIDMKELCEKLKKPYPKKSVKNIESDVTPFQEDEGGATPTLTHQ